jgi:hypothetical protein
MHAHSRIGHVRIASPRAIHQAKTVASADSSSLLSTFVYGRVSTALVVSRLLAFDSCQQGNKESAASKGTRDRLRFSIVHAAWLCVLEDQHHEDAASAERTAMRVMTVREREKRM